MQLHIIYTETDMLLSKRPYGSWKEIQDEYVDYKASLGPWCVEEVVEFLYYEYLDISPTAFEQVSSFLASADEVTKISFTGQ